MAVGDRIEIARQDTLENVQTNVSGIKNTTNNISTRVGNMGDIGGTANSGSLFAKLNAILTKTPNLDASISSVNSNLNIVKNNTNANHSASATGTLSQKLSHVINAVSSFANTSNTAWNNILGQLGNTTYGLNAIKSSLNGIRASVTGTGTTLYTSNQQIELRKSTEYLYIAKSVAAVDGIHAVNVTATKGEIKIYRLETVNKQFYLSNMNPKYAITGLDVCDYYTKGTIGSVCISSPASTNIGTAPLVDALSYFGAVKATTTATFYFHAKKGDPLVLLGNPSYIGDNFISSVTITYQS